MPAKVFISCGQALHEERQVAKSLSSWFTSQGYKPYVAIQVQSMLDLNSSIIGELKTSDYYLFVNFRREPLTYFPCREYRGSLFTNQELAIAYALEFDHVLMLNQRGVRREGIFQFMATNIPDFLHSKDVLDLVQKAVQTARWSPAFTRQLDIAGHALSEPFIYTDHTGTRKVSVLHVRILNGRPDRGAVDTIIRLSNIIDPNGNSVISPDRSRLKAAGYPGYSQTIWPHGEGTYDLLALDVASPNNVYLHSERDVHPRNPIISNNGLWILHYEIFSQGFPILAFRVDLTITGILTSTRATITKI